MTDFPDPATPPSAPEAASPLDGPTPHDLFSPASSAEMAARASRPGPRMRRRNFFSDMPDRGLFLLFACLGFFAILGLKLHGGHGMWTVVIPLSLMVGYAVLTWHYGMFRLHPDRLGDNCYYMGFLFTLASLSAALMEVETGPAAASGSLLEALIGNFGIALFSTIGGIALRVVFIQMRREVEELEEEVRQDLQQAAARLKDQLGYAVTDMESFRLRTRQVLTERLDEAGTAFAQQQREQAANRQRAADEEKAATERVAAVIALAANGLGDALRNAEQTLATQLHATTGALLGVQQRITQNLENAADLQSAATSRVAAVTSTAVEGVAGLVRRIAAIEVPPGLLLKQIEAAREHITALTLSLQGLAEADRERQAQFMQATQAVAAQMRQIVTATAAAAIESSAERLQHAVESMASRVGTLHDGLDRYAVAVEQLSAATESERTAMAAARGTIAADARQSTQALHELQATLTEIAEAIVRRLEPKG